MSTSSLVTPKYHLESAKMKIISRHQLEQFHLCYAAGTQTCIPLLTVHHQVTISQGVAVVRISQTYENIFNNVVELEYMFAIHQQAAFGEMQIQIGDRLFQATIKDKVVAKQEYQQGIAQGRTMVYADTLDTYPDILKVKLGNILPKEQLMIEFQYVQQLETCANQFWRLHVPAKLKPRYVSAGDVQQMFHMMKDFNVFDANCHSSVTVIFNEQQEFHQSPTHQLNWHNNQIQIHNQNNSDFILLFANQQIKQLMSCTTHINADNLANTKYCTTITLVPQVNALKFDDAYEAFVNDTDQTTYQVKGQFIFLLDRSGSMAGSLIDKAKSALILFIKSLPKDSYFNVISFGSEYTPMFNDCHINDDKTIKKALKTINNMKADMGGTEIAKPLEKAYKSKKFEQYLNIFVLTDGQVYGQEVFEIIRKYQTGNNRLYTIGIGDGCSTDFICTAAQLGNGLHTFIDSQEIFTDKIISLLTDSITPFLEQFKLEFNDSRNITMIIPNPDNIKMVRKNQPITFHITFNSDQKEDVELKLSCFDEQFKTKLETKININFMNSKESTTYHKLAIHKLIQSIQNSYQLGQPAVNDALMMQKEINEQDIIALSISNQVLSRLTAFICDITLDNSDEALQSVRHKGGLNYLATKSWHGSMGGSLATKGVRGGRGGSRGGRGGSSSSVWSPSYNAQPQLNCQASRSRSRDRCRWDKSPRERSKMKKCKKTSNSRNDRSESSSSVSMKQQSNYLDLIILQNSNGGFTDVSSISKLLNIKITPIAIEISIWLTIIVMCVLQTNYQADKASWKLVFNKANQYLQEHNIKYIDYKAQAIKLLTK